MSEFRPVDFKNMLVDVHKAAPGTDMLQIPIFKNTKEFNVKVEGINTNTLLRYIACMYDKESPFVKNIEDLRKRKFEAAVYSGFKVQENKLEPAVESKVIKCGDKLVSQMIIAYCMHQHSVLWQQWVIVQEAYYKESEKILTDKEYSDIKKLREIAEELQSIQNQFLSGEKEIAMIEDFYGFYVQRTLNLRPEAIAIKLREGQPLDLND